MISNTHGKCSLGRDGREQSSQQGLCLVLPVRESFHGQYEVGVFRVTSPAPKRSMRQPLAVCCGSSSWETSMLNDLQSSLNTCKSAAPPGGHKNDRG